MPTEILGLPIHPLAVHAPIILVPVTALCVVSYVLVPRIRANLGWLVILTTVVTVPAVFAARWSGQQLATTRMQELGDTDTATDVAATINHHAQYGDALIWLVAATAPLAWLFCAIASQRLARFATARSWNGLAARYDTGTTTRRVTLIGLGAILTVLTAASVAGVVLAGHSGAGMVWGA